MRFNWSNEPLVDLADTTDASPVGQWVNGVGLAGLLAVYAIVCFVTGTAIFPSRYHGGYAVYHDLAATALGTVYLSCAVFVHLHCFWTASPRFWGYAQLGKILALATVVGGMGLFFYTVLVIG